MSMDGGEDFWSWEPEKHGTYSVRSAYRLLERRRRQIEDVNVPNASSADGDWENVWSLDVPPKVRVFWWRVIHDCLPARLNLSKGMLKGLQIARFVEHLRNQLNMFSWSALWRGGSGRLLRTLLVSRFPCLHDVTWARDLLQPHICTKRDAAIIICGMWSLWTLRNKRRHGEEPISVWRAVE
jgi:hypothetical protein